MSSLLFLYFGVNVGVHSIEIFLYLLGFDLFVGSLILLIFYNFLFAILLILSSSGRFLLFMEGSDLKGLCEKDLGKDIVSAKSADSRTSVKLSKNIEGKQLSGSSTGDMCSTTSFSNESFPSSSSPYTMNYKEEIEEDEETVITGNMLPSPHGTGSSCSDSSEHSEGEFDEDTSFISSDIDELTIHKETGKEIQVAGGIEPSKEEIQKRDNQEYDGDLTQVPAKRLMVNASGSLLVLPEIENCNTCPYCFDVNHEYRKNLKQKNSYSPCEILQHRTLGSCWIVANNEVYDVTDFLTEHPAGAIAIARYGGGVKNCHEDMMFHSRGAQSKWKRMKIGTVTKCQGGFPIYSEFDNKDLLHDQINSNKETFKDIKDTGDLPSRSLANSMQSDSPSKLHNVDRISSEENICTIM